jgi:2-polyprenyl-3-methyl-5-hydroxy-6-metoxy-1,4-benzoquinol methylase
MSDMQGKNFDPYQEHRVVLNRFADIKLDSWHPDSSLLLKKQLPQYTFKNVLDIGSCGGSTLESLAVQGDKITLIDFAEKQLPVAKSKAMKQFDKVECFHVDLSKNSEIILKNAPYDLVICSQMIQHVPDEKCAEKIAKTAVEALSPGGILAFSCYRMRRRFFILPTTREGYFQNKNSAYLRIFFRRYTKLEILNLFKSLECVFIDDHSTRDDIIYVGRKNL